MSAQLDHPCKQTCTGWQQGFERGVSYAHKDYENKKQALIQTLKQISENRALGYSHMAADKALLDFIDDPEILVAFNSIQKQYT